MTDSVKRSNFFFNDLYEAVEQVTYNPYKYDSFVSLKDKRPLQGAEMVFMETMDAVDKKGNDIRIPVMWALNPIYK